MKETAWELTRKLIRTESSNPGKYETKVAELIENIIRDRIPEESFYRAEVEKGRPVIMAEIPGKSSKELVFICHMDTVPAGAGWTCDPFGAETKNGRIYGRGACDMKAGLAGALLAFLEEAEALGSTKKAMRTVKFIATMDEEGDMAGVEKAIELGWVGKDSLVIDAEPTGGEVQMAHKGRYWFQVTLYGKSAHASRPQDGADAIAGMAELICNAKKAVSALPGDSFLGQNTIVFGTILGGTQPYQVPDQCTVSVDVRAVPPYDEEDFYRILTDASEKACRAYGRAGKMKAAIQCTGSRPPVPAHKDSELLKRVSAAVKEISGNAPVIAPFPGYTDSAVVAAELHNPNCLSYGPGNLMQAHRPDEYVETAEIARCYAVYKSLIRSWT